MKKLIPFLLFFVSFALTAQEPLSFSKVITADGKNKTQLFVEINDWFAVNYNSANDVIQMADKDAGIIIGKGSMDYSLGKLIYVCYDGRLDYTVKVQFKEDRYKVDVSNFIHSVKPGNGQQCNLGLISIDEPRKKAESKVWSDVKVKAEVLAKTIFAELEKKTSKQETSSDW